MDTDFRGRVKAGSSTTTVMTGYHVGAVLTAWLDIVVIADLDWQSLLSSVPCLGIILAPIMIWLLPELPQFLMVKRRTGDANRIAAEYSLELNDGLDRSAAREVEQSGESGSVGTLLKPPYRRNFPAIWATSFMGLLPAYGLNTWMSQIMREAGYDMGNSRGFLMVLNIGAVVGLIIAGWMAA